MWVGHLTGANNMAVSVWGFRKAVVGTEWPFLSSYA